MTNELPFFAVHEHADEYRAIFERFASQIGKEKLSDDEKIAALLEAVLNTTAETDITA